MHMFHDALVSFAERRVISMAKKVYLAITILMILALLSGIPHLIDGICARSMTEVNYGIVGFPIFIGIWSFYKYKKTE